MIHYLKGDPAITSAFRNTTRGELALPAVVVYELEYRSLRSGLPELRRRELKRGLGSIRHIPFDSDAAFAAANIRHELERKGSAIGPLDLLIAGTALSRGATLVTNNTNEFSRVSGLLLVDWRYG